MHLILHDSINLSMHHLSQVVLYNKKAFYLVILESYRNKLIYILFAKQIALYNKIFYIRQHRGLWKIY